MVQNLRKIVSNTRLTWTELCLVQFSMKGGAPDWQYHLENVRIPLILEIDLLDDRCRSLLKYNWSHWCIRAASSVVLCPISASKRHFMGGGIALEDPDNVLVMQQPGACAASLTGIFLLELFSLKLSFRRITKIHKYNSE